MQMLTILYSSIWKPKPSENLIFLDVDVRQHPNKDNGDTDVCFFYQEPHVRTSLFFWFINKLQ